MSTETISAQNSRFKEEGVFLEQQGIMYYPWLHDVAPLLIGIALLLKG